YPRARDFLPRGHVPHNSGKDEPMETQESKPDKRRKFFKRAAIATLIGGIAAAIGIKAFAQGGGCGWHRGGFAAGALDPAALAEHLDRIPKHLYAHIDP